MSTGVSHRECFTIFDFVAESRVHPSLRSSVQKERFFFACSATLPCHRGSTLKIAREGETVGLSFLAQHVLFAALTSYVPNLCM